MNKETLKSVIQQWVERPLPNLMPRDLKIPPNSGKVVSLVGARRTGKTFLMFQLISELLASHVERSQILYLNFEDDRLGMLGDRPFTTF
jgi:uncharacterized protein